MSFSFKRLFNSLATQLGHPHATAETPATVDHPVVKHLVDAFKPLLIGLISSEVTHLAEHVTGVHSPEMESALAGVVTDLVNKGEDSTLGH